jgi:anti-repressor protein
MNELIMITESEKGEKLVSARELFEFLESKRDFTTWIKDKIDKYGFVENEDFTLHKFVEGKTWKHDYILKIDIAKEISMVEGNEKGRQARKYFIECERQLKEINKVKIPQTYAEALLEAGRLALENEKLLIENTEMKPKVEYYEKVIDSESEFTITQIAKEILMSGKALNKVLETQGIQYKQNGQWLLYSKYQNKGYTKTRTIKEIKIA